MPRKPDRPEGHEPGGGLRLQKLLAAAGFGSRRACEEYIEQGRVTIDGDVVRDLGVRVDPREQKVALDGEPVKPQPKRYFLVNKPPGYVSTSRDPLGRPRVIDLVPRGDLRLFTVGRLDAGSRGLILVTNDGEMSQRLAHPRFQIERRYEVQVAGVPAAATLDKLTRGMHFAEGKFRVRRIKRLRTQGKSAFLELVLTEGQNREIRRLLARVGHKVMQLKRVGFGPLHLGRLPEGRFRPLTDSELKSLRDLLDRPGKKERPRTRAKARSGRHK